MMWIPNPLDLSDINLGNQGDALIEKIAENIHDIWGAGRYQEGWRYGPVRDDREKLSPNMLPYELLPEEEKAYDRQSAICAIKAAIKLGLVQLTEESET